MLPQKKRRCRLDIPRRGSSTGCSGTARRSWSARSGRADAPALVGCTQPCRPARCTGMCSWPSPTLSLEEAARFSEVDYDARMAFVALVSGELVGLASYDRPATSVGGCRGQLHRHRPLPAAMASRPCCSRAWRSTRGRGGSCASSPRSGRRTRPCWRCSRRRACAAPGGTARRRCGSRSICGRRRRTARRAISGRRRRRWPASRRSSGRARSQSSGQDATRATSAIRLSGPCSSATSPELSTRSIRPRGRSAACPRSRRCCRFPSRSTWPSSPFRPQLSPA